MQKAYRAGARGKYSKLSNQALTLGSQRLRMEGGLGSCGVSPWPDDDECSDRQNPFPPLRGVNKFCQQQIPLQSSNKMMISDPVIQSAGMDGAMSQQQSGGVMQGRPRNFPTDPSACKHFVIVWPQYLEHSYTLAQGRRLPKESLEGCMYFLCSFTHALLSLLLRTSFFLSPHNIH